MANIVFWEKVRVSPSTSPHYFLYLSCHSCHSCHSYLTFHVERDGKRLDEGPHGIVATSGDRASGIVATMKCDCMQQRLHAHCNLAMVASALAENCHALGKTEVFYTTARPRAAF